MITRNVTCDICCKSIGSNGGAYVNLHQHDLVEIVETTYPPQYPGRFDLCDECRDALASWLDERRKKVSK